MLVTNSLRLQHCSTAASSRLRISLGCDRHRRRRRRRHESVSAPHSSLAHPYPPQTLNSPYGRPVCAIGFARLDIPSSFPCPCSFCSPSPSCPSSCLSTTSPCRHSTGLCVYHHSVQLAANRIESNRIDPIAHGKSKPQPPIPLGEPISHPRGQANIHPGPGCDDPWLQHSLSSTFPLARTRPSCTFLFLHCRLPASTSRPPLDGPARLAALLRGTSQAGQGRRVGECRAPWIGVRCCCHCCSCCCCCSWCWCWSFCCALRAVHCVEAIGLAARRSIV